MNTRMEDECTSAQVTDALKGAHTHGQKDSITLHYTTLHINSLIPDSEEVFDPIPIRRLLTLLILEQF